MILKDAENTVLSTKRKEEEGCSVIHVSTAVLTHVLTTDAVVSSGARTGDTSLELLGCNMLVQHYKYNDGLNLRRLKLVWNDRSISLSSKIRLMRSLVASIFLYASVSCLHNRSPKNNTTKTPKTILQGTVKGEGGGREKTRQTEEEVERQHQGMGRPGVCQVPEGSGKQGKIKETGCEVIRGAPTTLAVSCTSLKTD